MKVWQLPVHFGNHTVTGAATDVLFTEPATQHFFTDALPRDAAAKIVKLVDEDIGILLYTT